MTETPARPDLAHTNAIKLEPAVLVTRLRDLLGAKLVAYLGGVKETRAVRQWAEGTRAISGSADLQRLRLAYQVAKLLGGRDDADVIQAWFQGLNPALGDRSPARLLRDGALATSGRRSWRPRVSSLPSADVSRHQRDRWHQQRRAALRGRR